MTQAKRRARHRVPAALRRDTARLIAAFFVLALAVSAEAADLLDGIRIEPEAEVTYNRARDYGGWAKPEPCMTTRMVVLRDESEPSRTQIARRTSGACDVWIGLWHELYVGYDTTDPRQLDIDHLVPLKEAHRSGAASWPKAKRREYANFLADPWHLLAVDAGANRAKGDQDPAHWLPANPAVLCAYLQHWIDVKRRWALSMDRAEAEAIRVRYAERSCSP